MLNAPPRYVVDEPWSKVPVSLIDAPGMTLSALRLYLFLDEKVGKRGWWYGSQQEIASELGTTDRTVRTCTSILDGYVAVERLGIEQGTRLKYLVLARTLVVEPETDRKDSSGRLHEISGVSGNALPVVPTLLTEELTDQREISAPEISNIDAEERLAISRESLPIYSALAGQLGIFNPPQGWAERWLRECTPETIMLAIGKAQERNAHSTAYVDKILTEPTFTATKARQIRGGHYNQPVDPRTGLRAGEFSTIEEAHRG